MVVVKTERLRFNVCQGNLLYDVNCCPRIFNIEIYDPKKVSILTKFGSSHIVRGDTGRVLQVFTVGSSLLLFNHWN